MLGDAAAQPNATNNREGEERAPVQPGSPFSSSLQQRCDSQARWGRRQHKSQVVSRAPGFNPWHHPSSVASYRQHPLNASFPINPASWSHCQAGSPAKQHESEILWCKEVSQRDDDAKTPGPTLLGTSSDLSGSGIPLLCCKEFTGEPQLPRVIGCFSYLCVCEKAACSNNKQDLCLKICANVL